MSVAVPITSLTPQSEVIIMSPNRSDLMSKVLRGHINSSSAIS